MQNEVFALLGIALISAQKLICRKKNKSAVGVLSQVESPMALMSSEQIGITLTGCLNGMFSGNKVTAIFRQMLADAGNPLDKRISHLRKRMRINLDLKNSLPKDWQTLTIL